jgi:hypothetical protein
MKELTSYILIVFFISAPIMLVLAIGFVALKKYGDSQREKYLTDKRVYDDKYLYIRVLIATMQISDEHYHFIDDCINQLSGLSYKNQEKTDALYRSLDLRFKSEDIKQFNEVFSEV